MRMLKCPEEECIVWMAGSVDGNVPRKIAIDRESDIWEWVLDEKVYNDGEHMYICR